MSPEKPTPGSALDWIRRARSDLALARAPLPPAAAEAVGLTSYAVMSRYPGDYEEVTEEAYEEAVQLAQAVFAWAERTVRAPAAKESSEKRE
jgi:HEPN domain